MPAPHPTHTPSLFTKNYAQRGAQIRVEASQREAAAVMTLREDLERQLQRTMKQLNDSNAQTRALQEQNQSLQNALGREKSEHGQGMSDLEAHVHRIELELKTTGSDRDALRVQVKALRRELGEQAAESSEQQRRLAALEHESTELRTQASADAAKYKNQAHSLADSMKKLQSQLERTKKLLATVQEQREMMKTTNAELREELDAVYKSRTSGA